MDTNYSEFSAGYPKADQRKKVFCILSDERVFRTKSPNMFNAAIKHAGINGIYIPLKVESDNLGKAIQSLKVLNFAGANVTVPYKETVVSYMDILSDEAGLIGAVNTITIEKEMLKGHNTNAIGFRKAIEEVGYHAKDKTVLVFGSGGAARAVVFALKQLQSGPILIAGRNKNKTRKLASDLGAETIDYDELKSCRASAAMVINATSVASHDESPEMVSMVENMVFNNCQWVIDLNYGRQAYFFRDLAQKIGTRFMDGIPMLAYQASKSLALWTGIDVSPAVFLTGL